MREPLHIAMFYHSLVSDWNHGNAHFLRGVAGELRRRGHWVRVYEPEGNWSRSNLLADHGPAALEGFEEAYPGLTSISYDLAGLDLDHALSDVDLVIAHEWNEPALIARLSTHRSNHGHYRLLFHDTHHRIVSRPDEMARYDLSGFDGVLAFGEVIRRAYLTRGWARRAWTWHEAADTRLFHPRADQRREGDLVWIGNWGDEERTRELDEFLIKPVRQLGLRTTVYGVRYPLHAQRALRRAGIRYGGWLANHQVPTVLARYRATVHIPRRYYVRQLPGIPTIRPFEALACGTPLICSPWEDRENLFEPGKDFQVARRGRQMKRQLKTLMRSPSRARRLAEHGLETIRRRHTCAHRVDQLLRIVRELDCPNLPASVPDSSPHASTVSRRWDSGGKSHGHRSHGRRPGTLGAGSVSGG